MRAFHIDMNTARFRADYLDRWLVELAALGYDAVVWEVEDNVRWESCPGCAAPDAFTKDEFAGLLARCRALGLEPIPLLQIIGHAEYVLKHEDYAPLRELPGRIDQYCPRNAEVHALLARWVDECCELFGPIRRFHLGADEAYALGRCDACRHFAEEHSLSLLYVEHVNRVASRVRARGIRPMIWADMLLNHPEAIDLLDRDVLLCDWQYRIRRGDGRIWAWKPFMRLFAKHELPGELRERYEEDLFPFGDEPGREPETFYTAEHLRRRGFDVVTCPASASGGDSAFAPRSGLHLHNCWDSVRKGGEAQLSGWLLTSWTQRLLPWELQLGTIAAPAYQQRHPGAAIADYQRAFARERFGLDEPERFWRAAALLSEPCPLSEAAELGIGKHGIDPAPDHIPRLLARWAESGDLDALSERCLARGAAYQRGVDMFTVLAAQAPRGNDVLARWLLAARCLRHRAATAALLIAEHDAVRTGRALDGVAAARASELLSEARALRRECDEAYRAEQRPARAAQIVRWLWDGVEEALTSLAGAGTAATA